MGWPDRAISGVVLAQSATYAVAAYVPASIVAFGLYRATERLAGIPMVLTPANLAIVLVLTVAASLASGRLAVRKLASASPAELF
jgi:putative ABC transport system permease protein